MVVALLMIYYNKSRGGATIWKLNRKHSLPVWTARITTIHRAAAVLTLQVQQEDVPTAPILWRPAFSLRLLNYRERPICNCFVVSSPFIRRPFKKPTNSVEPIYRWWLYPLCGASGRPEKRKNDLFGDTAGRNFDLLTRLYSTIRCEHTPISLDE